MPPVLTQEGLQRPRASTHRVDHRLRAHFDLEHGRPQHVARVVGLDLQLLIHLGGGRGAVSEGRWGRWRRGAQADDIALSLSSSPVFQMTSRFQTEATQHEMGQQGQR